MVTTKDRHESYQRPVIIVVLGALSTSRPLVLNSSLALQGHPQCEILVESPNRGLAGMEDSVPRRCDYASDIGAFPVSRAVKCRVDVGACPLPAAASCGVERVGTTASFARRASAHWVTYGLLHEYWTGRRVGLPASQLHHQLSISSRGYWYTAPQEYSTGRNLVFPGSETKG